MNDPFLVFGTGRSATSFVAGVMHNKLGISMGEEFAPPNHTNPEGFWEDIDFYNLNKDFVFDRILFSEFYEKAQKLIFDRSSSGEPWGFKESRMSHILPMYLSLLNEPKLIWCQRDKDLTVKSCMRCYGWEEEEASKMLEARYSIIKNILQGREHLVINFGRDRMTEEEVAHKIITALKPKIKVYVAILNRGWFRREVAARLLPKMKKMKGLEITLENPSKTWDHPISSNRNQIVKRFLATDNEFLLMLDNDVVPLGNPLRFVFANKDVVGSPAKVRQGDRQLNWVAYVKRPDRDEYAPVDFTKVDQEVELLKVDAIGTGCILIHRRVLEEVGKAPFHTTFDEDGILTEGTDFAFSRRAREAGFEIYTTPKDVCEHFKDLGMLDLGSYSDSDGVDSEARKYEIPWGGYAINPIDWEFIKRIIIDTQPKNILEFGAGLSSLLMSEYAQVDAYEESDEWAEILAKKANGNLSIYHIDDDLLAHDYDLVFIDGPVGLVNGGPGREDAFSKAVKFDKIIVHDAGREEEHGMQNKYLMKDFTLVKKNGWHQSRCQYWERK